MSLLDPLGPLAAWARDQPITEHARAKRLWFFVLFWNLSDWVNFRNRRGGQRIFREANRWLYSDPGPDEEPLPFGSVQFVCSLFNCPVKDLRRVVPTLTKADIKRIRTVLYGHNDGAGRGRTAAAGKPDP